jgi:hypothetical protein
MLRRVESVSKAMKNSRTIRKKRSLRTPSVLASTSDACATSCPGPIAFTTALICSCWTPKLFSVFPAFVTNAVSWSAYWGSSSASCATETIRARQRRNSTR